MARKSVAMSASGLSPAGGNPRRGTTAMARARQTIKAASSAANVIKALGTQRKTLVMAQMAQAGGNFVIPIPEKKKESKEASFEVDSDQGSPKPKRGGKSVRMSTSPGNKQARKSAAARKTTAGGTAGASRARAGKSTVGFEIQDEETLDGSSSSEEFDGNADYR